MLASVAKMAKDWWKSTAQQRTTSGLQYAVPLGMMQMLKLLVDSSDSVEAQAPCIGQCMHRNIFPYWIIIVIIMVYIYIYIYSPNDIVRSKELAWKRYSHFDCSGDENRLTGCDFVGPYPYKCQSTYYAGVVCTKESEGKLCLRVLWTLWDWIQVVCPQNDFKGSSNHDYGRIALECHHVGPKWKAFPQTWYLSHSFERHRD